MEVARWMAGTMMVWVESETPAVARGVAGTAVVQAASGKGVVRVAVAREATEIPAPVAVVLPERLAEQKWRRVTRQALHRPQVAGAQSERSHRRSLSGRHCGVGAVQ